MSEESVIMAATLQSCPPPPFGADSNTVMPLIAALPHPHRGQSAEAQPESCLPACRAAECLRFSLLSTTNGYSSMLAVLKMVSHGADVPAD